jgi:hypothetical protein
MEQSELRTMIQEVVREELAARAALKEEVKSPGYVIKAWNNPEKTSLVFDSEAKDIRYPEFEDVVKALQTNELSDLGVYEITWIKS